MQQSKMLIVISVGIGVFLLFSSWVMAQRRVVDDVEITGRHGCAEIKVSFNFPVRYTRHFPHAPARELRVQLKPFVAAPADRDGLFNREVVRVPSESTIPLFDIIYEGDLDAGPFLSFSFSQDVSFTVAQGDDFRSLVVTPYLDSKKQTCFESP